MGLSGESQLFRMDAIMTPHVESAKPRGRERLSLKSLLETLDQPTPEARRAPGHVYYKTSEFLFLFFLF